MNKLKVASISAVVVGAADPEMIATIAAISAGSSFLRFTANTSGGECTTVKVMNSSQSLPLTP